MFHEKKTLIVTLQAVQPSKKNPTRTSWIFQAFDGLKLYRTFNHSLDKRADQVCFVEKMLGRELALLELDPDRFQEIIQNLRGRLFTVEIAPANNPKFWNITEIKPANTDTANSVANNDQVISSKKITRQGNE